MQEPARIIDRGRGPEIEGTRVTVYVVFEYVQAGRAPEWIAGNLRVSVEQVQAAMKFIEEHKDEVESAYKKAQERIEQGNPEWADRRLTENRVKFEAFVKQCRERNGSPEARRHAGNHVRQ
jgi:uncharacterized protein (DUF433 family)